MALKLNALLNAEFRMVKQRSGLRYPGSQLRGGLLSELGTEEECWHQVAGGA